MAVAIKIQTTPQQLLNELGWSTVRSGVLKPVPGDQYGNPVIPITVEAFEWEDVTLFGWGNVDNSIAQLQAAIRQRGSDLYSYKLQTRTDVNFLGLKAVRYRLTLLHSFVELLEWAVAILAIGFAAIIFLQYLTTGQAPALKDLQTAWGSAVTSIGQAGSTVVGSVTSAYVWAAIAVGAVAVGFGVISKHAGTKAPTPLRMPGGSIGVRSGGISGRVGA